MKFLFKHNLSFLFACLISIASFAQNQGKFTTENLDASAVPEVVKQSQESYFPGIKVQQWKKHTLTTAKGETFYQYEAWYMHNGKQLAKAHYGVDGKGQSVTIYYGAPGTPQAVKDGALKQFPGFKFISSTYVRILSSNKEGYKAILQKGTQKVEAWLDVNGGEISKEYFGAALKDLWGI